MIGVIIVTYGHLADAFKDAVEHVLGPQSNLHAFGLEYQEDVADIQKRRDMLLQVVQSADQGSGVVILTDMFGGAPSNLSLSLLDLENLEVIAGVNLPMLVKLLSIREKMPLEQMVAEAQEAGRHYINVASHFLKAAEA